MKTVNAGLINMIVVDNYLVKFWSQIFKDITLYHKIAIKSEGEIAWMIRKDSPKLKQVVNKFVKNHKKGFYLGNIMLRRYLKSRKYVRNSLADEDLKRFKAAIALFRNYAGTYDMDWLLVAALAYQESRIEQSAKRPRGAVGVMQNLPSTAAGYSSINTKA